MTDAEQMLGRVKDLVFCEKCPVAVRRKNLLNTKIRLEVAKKEREKIKKI
jgi:hypothetical protein